MTDRRIAVAGAILAAGVFALDVLAGVDMGVGALYAVPLLLLSYAGSTEVTIASAWLASLLIAGRALTVPVADLPLVVVTNRAIALVVVWATASVAVRLRRASSELTSSARDLNDVKYALDQSAIVATTNTRGLITYVNEKFCEISKYRREELLGQDHRILNSAYHPKDFIRNLWVTIANGQVWRGEIRNRAKDGSFYWVDTTIVPFLDGRGKPYQYMAIRYEITERKRTEELLREQAALARLGEMAAVVAHEIKNPIAGIRGALQVIMGRMPPEQRDRAVMNDIIARLDSLNVIVHDLLLYARPRQPRKEPVEIAELIDSTRTLLRRDPAHAAVSVTVRGSSPPIAGDPEQLRSLLQNVMLNAAQAMKGEGAIDVDLRADESGSRIVIRDHGPGMTPEVLEKAFDAFFTTKHRGTGLGLPIAKRVVEAHGGTIDLAQAEDGGTLVSLWFPALRITTSV